MRSHILPALGIAAGLHAFVLAGIGIVGEPLQGRVSELRLDVTLLNSQKPSTPQAAAYLGQQDASGAGNTQLAVTAQLALNATASTLISRPDAGDALAAQRASGTEQGRHASKGAVVAGSAAALSASNGGQQGEDASNADARPQEPQPGSEGNDSITEQAHVTGRESRIEDMLPGTRRTLAAQYRQDWHDWIADIGNRHYPEALRRRQLQGEVLAQVALAADGRVLEVRVLRSAGEPLLDRAVSQTLRRAGTYRPFPAELAASTDVLILTYRWRWGS